MTAPRPTAATLRTARAIWLLEIDALGRSWRWASEPVTVTDATTGTAYPFVGGLPRIEVLVGAVPGSPVPDPQPVTLDLHWPDLLTLIRRGARLRGTGELSWWVIGTDYRRRLRVVSGEITASQYEDAGAPGTITLTPDLGTETALVPSPAFVVDSEAWPVDSGNPGGPMPDAVGRVCPVVFGSPGQVSVIDPASAIYGERLAFPGSPALPVTTSLTIAGSGDRVYSARLLAICQGRTGAGSVEICYPATVGDGWQTETFPVTTETDALGRTWSVVDVSSSTAGNDLERAEDLYTSWTNNYATTEPAIIGDDGRAVTGAGGVIDWMMRRSTIAYDSAAWLGVRSHLDAWAVDTYLDEPVGPWTWLAEALLPGLPVSVVPSPDGIRPVIWRPDADASRAVDHLRAGHDCSRSSAVAVVTAAQPAVTVEYATDADSGDTRGSAALAPEPDVDAAVAGSVWSRAGRDLMRLDGSEIVAAAWTCSRATAYAVAAWRSALALGWREVEVDVAQERGWLALGDVVLFTDATAGLYSAVGQVGAIIYRDSGAIGLRLILWGASALSSSSVPLSDIPREPQN